MGTETRYLIGLGAKLWKTGVSISSDVNGSVIGTGEIKKTHIHLLLLYIHIILQILSRQSHQLFLYAIIFKLLSMMHFCYSQIRSEIAHVDEFSTRNISPVYDRRELTIKTCLHFRPVAVILNWVYLMFFLASKDYSRVSSSTTSFSSQRRTFVPPWPKLNVRIRSIICRLL